MTVLRFLAGTERGATMVEYGLLLALIVIVCIGVVTLLGQNVLQLYNVPGFP